MQITVVGQADDVAGIGVFGRTAILGQEQDRVVHVDLLTATHMFQLHALSEMTRTDAHEGHAIPMFRVHICLDLEYEA